MLAGTVKFYNSEQRFGYVQQANDTTQFRVLGSALMRAGIKSLVQGQKVDFDTHTDPDSGHIVINTIKLA